jgi:hypothetical protein
MSMKSGDAIRRISNALLAVACRMLPRNKDGWGEAMRAEAAELDRERWESVRWSLGCVWAAVVVQAREPDTAYVLLLSGLCAALVYLDWHTMETAATIAALVLIAAFLGFTHAKRALATGATVGCVLFVAHGLATVTGEFLPFYQCQNPSVEDWVTVFALAGPGMLSALAGRFIRTWTGRVG